MHMLGYRKSMKHSSPNNPHKLVKRKIHIDSLLSACLQVKNLRSNCEMHQTIAKVARWQDMQ